MIWYVLIPLIATFTNISLGLGVLLSETRNPIRRRFSIFCFCIAFWNFCSAMIYYLPKDGAAFWAQLLLIPLVFIAPTFFHFVLTFIKDQSNFRKYLCIAGYAYGGVLLILNRIIPIVLGVEHHYWGYYPQVSELTHLIDFQFLSLMIYGIYLLVKQYANETSSVSRNQIKYLFIGVILALASSSTNFTPFMGIEIPPMGHLGQIFYNFIIAYAIIKYRLLDINLFLKKSIFYFIWVALLFGFCLFIIQIIILSGEHIKMHNVCITSLILAIAFSLSYLVFARVRGWMNQRLFTVDGDAITGIEQLGNRVLSKTGLNVNKLIKDTLDNLIEILGLSGGCMFLSETGGEKYDIVYATGCCSNSEKSASIPGDSSLIDLLSAQRKPIVKEELELKTSLGSYEPGEKEKLLAAAAQLDEFGIAVCIPLITRGNIIGLLNLGPKKSGRLFSSEELNKLAALGNELAIALENAKLVEESRNKAEEQEVLAKIAYEIMSLHNPIKLEQQIFTHIGNIIDYDRCLYLSWSEETRSLVLEYAEGFDESAKESLNQIMLEYELSCFSGQPRSRTTENISNNKSRGDFDDVCAGLVHEDNESHYHLDKHKAHKDAEQIARIVENYLNAKKIKQSEEASLCIPIFAERKLYGVFGVFRTQGVYLEEQKRLLQVVGSQIVALYERMTSTLARAETAAMTRALRGIAHDMSHAFGILRGSFEMLQERLSEVSETDQRIASDLIKSEVKQLDRLLTELKRLTDEENIRLRQEEVNVALNRALQLLKSRLSTSKIEVTCDLQAVTMSVLIPGGQLTRVFFNLLLNAIEAMPEGGVLKLTSKLKTRQEEASPHRGDKRGAIKTANSVQETPNGQPPTPFGKGDGVANMAEITISDTGCGISDNHLDKIFKSGFTTKASSGLGLAEVKRIINTCGGKIAVHSQVGVGTSFVIQLPCYR